MTAAAVAFPVAPLAHARAGGFGLGVRATPAPPGWHEAGAAAGDARLLTSLLARTCHAAGTRAGAVAATWYLEKHAWLACGAALAGLLVHGAVPPLDRAFVRHADEGWVDAIAVPEHGWERADPAVLAALLEAHLAPLVAALSDRRPARALWLCAGDRLGQAAIWCGEAFGDRTAAWSLAAAALEAPTALEAPAGLTLREGEPFRRRRGCCLSHRCPAGATCDDCPLSR